LYSSLIISTEITKLHVGPLTPYSSPLDIAATSNGVQRSAIVLSNTKSSKSCDNADTIDLIKYIESKFPTKNGFTTFPIYQDQLLCILPSTVFKLSDIDRNQLLGNACYIDCFILNNRWYYVFKKDKENKQAQALFTAFKNHCSQLYASTSFSEIIDIQDTLHIPSPSLHILLLDRGSQYSLSCIYYQSHTLLAAKIKIESNGNDMHRLLLGDDDNGKYVAESTDKVCTIYNCFDGKKICSLEINKNDTFFKKILFTIYKKPSGLEKFEKDFLGNKQTSCSHILEDIVYQDAKDFFIILVLQKTILNSIEQRLDKKYLLSITSCALSKKDSSIKPIKHNWLFLSKDNNIDPDNKVYFSRENGFKDLFSNTQNIDSTSEDKPLFKEYELFSIDNIDLTKPTSDESIKEIVAAMQEPTRNKTSTQLLLTDDHEEQFDNKQMVSFNTKVTSPRESHIFLTEILTSLLNSASAKPDQNYNKARPKPAVITFDMHMLADLFLQMVDRLNHFEEKYAIFKDDYDHLIKTMKQNNNNLESTLKSLQTLHTKITNDLINASNAVDKLQKRIVTVTQENTQKISDLEKEYKGKFDKLNEIIKSYEEVINTYKKNVELLNNSIAQAIEEKINDACAKKIDSLSTEMETVKTAIKTLCTETLKECKEELETIKNQILKAQKELLTKSNDQLTTIKAIQESNQITNYLLGGGAATIAILVAWLTYSQWQIIQLQKMIAAPV
jgi:hypothetical protein